MKKALSILLAVVLVASVLPFSLTATAATSSYYTYSVSNGEATITDVSTSISGDVNIPSNLGGYPVKSIGNSAFYGCYRLTSITIPNSVTSIGSGAFSNCTRLTSITVEEGNTVFYSKNNCLIETESKTLISGCKNSIIPTDGSVTSIGDAAFYCCTGLISITIPDSVTSIGEYAFYGCTGLTSITIGNSVTSIGSGAFYGCTGLTNITIPNSVTSIGDDAFYGCTGLTSITVEEGNTIYHSKNNCIIETDSKTLVLGCKNSIIPTDGSVTCIGGSAFCGCTGLTSITIPNSVTSIGDWAFYNCTGLEDVWYTGSEEDKNDISIGSFNSALLNATWHYNYVPTPDIKYGCVNDDGEISATDALAILQASVGKIQFTDLQKIAGDIDGDGTLTAYDALLTLQYSVGKIDKFPVEG